MFDWSDPYAFSKAHVGDQYLNISGGNNYIDYKSELASLIYSFYLCMNINYRFALVSICLCVSVVVSLFTGLDSCTFEY